MATNGFDIAPLIDFIKKHANGSLISLDGPSGETFRALMGPNGQGGVTITSLKALEDERREVPQRRKGTAELQDLKAFTDHANRFKEWNSALFAWRDPKTPSLTSVLDYHPAETPNADARFGQHRGLYKFPVSEAWKFWTDNDGAGDNIMNQAEFAAFIEDRILDIAPVPPTISARLQEMLDKLGRPTIAGPSTMLDLSRGLSINVESTAGGTMRLQSGEVALQWSEVHKDSNGQPVKIAEVFLLGIPIFDRGPSYLIPVRLRYRLSGGKVVWWYQMFRPDLAFDDAFSEACTAAAAATSLPLFMGKPENNGQ